MVSYVKPRKGNRYQKDGDDGDADDANDASREHYKQASLACGHCLAHAFFVTNVLSLGNKRSANLLLLSRRSMMVSKQLAWTTWPSLCASPHTMYFPIGRSCKLTLGFKGAMYLYWSNIISDWVISNPQKSRAPHLLVGVGVSFDLYSFITGRLTGEVIIIGLVSTIAVSRSCCEL